MDRSLLKPGLGGAAPACFPQVDEQPGPAGTARAAHADRGPGVGQRWLVVSPAEPGGGVRLIDEGVRSQACSL